MHLSTIFFVFHSNSWMVASVEAYSYFILFQLIFLTVSIACIVFMIDLVNDTTNRKCIKFSANFSWYKSFCAIFQQIQHLGFDICILVLGFFTCSSSPFMYCYFGKNSSDCYANMGDRLYETNWQHIPIDLQKYFIIIIGNMQRPLYYHGFQIFTVNLETFQQVTRK